MNKKFTALALGLAVILAGCSSLPEPNASGRSVPQETLSEIADYIAGNTEGRIDREDIQVYEMNYGINISATRGLGDVDSVFGVTCELVTAAANAALEEYSLNLARLTITAESSANSDNKVVWTSTDFETGTLTDTRNGEDSVTPNVRADEVAEKLTTE